MLVIKSDKVLFVDVDDTLVVWKGRSYTPHKKHIDVLHQFAARGQKIIVWSAGGYKWARRIVKELGLESIVYAVMAKPAWCMDDKAASEFIPESSRFWLPDQS